MTTQTKPGTAYRVEVDGDGVPELLTTEVVDGQARELELATLTADGDTYVYTRSDGGVVLRAALTVLAPDAWTVVAVARAMFHRSYDDAPDPLKTVMRGDATRLLAMLRDRAVNP